MTDSAHGYMQVLIKENEKLRKENEKLRKKIRSKKPDIKPETKAARTEMMRVKWLPGGENYHNSKVYKAFDIDQLGAYHKKHPDAEAGSFWRDHIFNAQKKK